MNRHLALVPAALAAAALTLAGCSTTGSEDDDGTLSVLASFYPLQFVAERVGGDLVDVQNLTPPAAEPHDLELSPAQVRSLGEADLVVSLSGFQPAVDEAIEQRSPAHVVDAASVADLVESPNGSHAEDEHAEETDHAEDDHAAEEGHAKETEHADEEGHAEADEHDHGGLDPHFWLDPTRLGPLADAIADELAAIDPENADTYRANAATLEDDVTSLDTEMAAALAACSGATLVTSHEAFGYLAQRYDLDQVGITGVNPEAEPSPARLREVKEIVTEENVRTIYFETLVSPKVTETLAADLGVATAVLDPLESLADGATDYLGVMRTNLDSLTSGLTCS